MSRSSSACIGEKKTIGQLGGMGSGTTTTQYYYVTASPMESVQVMNDNSMVLGAVILERRNPYLATPAHYGELSC